MGDHREAELAGQSRGQVVPRPAAVVRAVLAAVVLLVEPLGRPGGHHQLVDALAGLRRRAGHEVGPDALVARLPGRPAVGRLERPDGRDRDPHPIRVGRVGTIEWRISPPAPGCPGRSAGVVRQALDVGPGPAAVIAPEQAGDPDAGVDRAVGRGDVPDGGDLRAVLAIGQPVARLRPRLAQVVAPEDGRPVPGRAAAGIERPGRRVAADVLDRVPLAGRAADRPRPSGGIRLEDEGALLGANEEQDPIAHDALLGSGDRAAPAALA